MTREFTPIELIYFADLNEIFYASLHVAATKKNTVELNRNQIQFLHKKTVTRTQVSKFEL
mgnify:CR=1 FL=1